MVPKMTLLFKKRARSFLFFTGSNTLSILKFREDIASSSRSRAPRRKPRWVYGPELSVVQGKGARP